MPCRTHPRAGSRSSPRPGGSSSDASRSRRPVSTNRSAAAPTKGFVTLAIRNRDPGTSGSPLARSATPAATSRSRPCSGASTWIEPSRHPGPALDVAVGQSLEALTHPRRIRRPRRRSASAVGSKDGDGRGGTLPGIVGPRRRDGHRTRTWRRRPARRTLVGPAPQGRSRVDPARARSVLRRRGRRRDLGELPGLVLRVRRPRHRGRGGRVADAPQRRARSRSRRGRRIRSTGGGLGGTVRRHAGRRLGVSRRLRAVRRGARRCSTGRGSRRCSRPNPICWRSRPSPRSSRPRRW